MWVTQRREPPREALTAPRGHHGTTLACQRHTTRLEQAHMGSTTCVLCTLWPQRHGAWCGLPPPCAGTRTPKPCAVSQLMKPWAQCHGLMAPIADSHQVAYAQRRGAMPCVPRRIGHGRNAMARCWEASNKPKPWAPRHDTGSHISVGKAH